MIDNIHEHMFGTDASNEISLLEYGLLVAHGEIVNPEQCAPSGEYFCVYRRDNGRFGTGYKHEYELNNLIEGKEWMDEKKIESFLSSQGMNKDEWLNLPFHYKLSDLLHYFSDADIMGTDYYPMTETEAKERYLGWAHCEEEKEESPVHGDMQLLFDGNRGIYIPQNFAQGCRAATVNADELKDEFETLLVGPDHHWYWDAWNTMIDKARLLDSGNGKYYYLLQEDGDCWAIEEGTEPNWE